MKRRLVVDTSTLIGAAIKPDSIPRRALLLALSRFELCLSDRLLKELTGVLARRQFERYAPAQAFRAYVDSIQTESRIFTLSAEDLDAVSGQCRDSSDAHILALLLLVKADLLISSDSDLLTLHPWRGIPILTPAQFLDQS